MPRIETSLPRDVRFELERDPQAPEGVSVAYLKDDPGVVNLVADIAVPVVAPVRLTPGEAERVAACLLAAAEEARAAVKAQPPTGERERGGISEGFERLAWANIVRMPNGAGQALYDNPATRALVAIGIAAGLQAMTSFLAQVQQTTGTPINLAPLAETESTTTAPQPAHVELGTMTPTPAGYVALVVPVTGPARRIRIPDVDVLRVLRSEIGSQRLDHTPIDHQVQAWVGDNSLRDGSPVNERVTQARDRILIMKGLTPGPTPLCGTVVLIGVDYAGGGATIDLPEAWQRLADR
jgi:hypothetical protein